MRTNFGSPVILRGYFLRLPAQHILPSDDFCSLAFLVNDSPELKSPLHTYASDAERATVIVRERQQNRWEEAYQQRTISKIERKIVQIKILFAL